MKRQFSISMEESVIEVLLEDSKKFGLSKSAYISQLVMQKNMELNAMRLVSKLTDEQIAEEVRKQFKVG